MICISFHEKQNWRQQDRMNGTKLQCLSCKNIICFIMILIEARFKHWAKEGHEGWSQRPDSTKETSLHRLSWQLNAVWRTRKWIDFRHNSLLLLVSSDCFLLMIHALHCSESGNCFCRWISEREQISLPVILVSFVVITYFTRVMSLCLTQQSK